MIYAAAAARNARAPRGQKNASRIFALLFFTKFFCDDDFLKKIYESFFENLLQKIFPEIIFNVLILRKLHKKKSVGTLNFLPK